MKTKMVLIPDIGLVRSSSIPRLKKTMERLLKSRSWPADYGSFTLKAAIRDTIYNHFKVIPVVELEIRGIVSKGWREEDRFKWESILGYSDEPSVRFHFEKEELL